MQQSLTGRLVGSRGSKLFATRGGTIGLGVAAAVLAALLLIVYLNRYRASLNTAAEPTPVLVAKRLITKGTSASVIGSQGALQLTTIPQEHVKDTALADPDALRGRVAARDIYPGQQLTLADFSATTTNAVSTRIVGAERALNVSVDPQHGMIGQVSAGDHVDVYVSIDKDSIPVVSLLRADVEVLEAPGASSGGGVGGNTSNYVLKVPTGDIPRFAYAADYGRVWIVARPANEAKPTKAGIVTIQHLLVGGR